MPDFQLHCCGAQDRALPGNRTPRLRSLPLTGYWPARGTVSVSKPGSLKPDAALLRCPWPGLPVGGAVETGRGRGDGAGPPVGGAYVWHRPLHLPRLPAGRSPCVWTQPALVATGQAHRVRLLCSAPPGFLPGADSPVPLLPGHDGVPRPPVEAASLPQICLDRW